MVNVDYFRDNLIFLLDRLGIKQVDLVYSLRLHPNSVSRWITGKSKPQSRTQQTLCDYFNDRLNLSLSIEQLLGEDVSKLLGGNMETTANQIEAATTPGFQEFVEDHKLLKLMNVSGEELEALKTIRFVGSKFPITKKFYIDVLFRYREDKE